MTAATSTTTAHATYSNITIPSSAVSNSGAPDDATSSVAGVRATGMSASALNKAARQIAAQEAQAQDKAAGQAVVLTRRGRFVLFGLPVMAMAVLLLAAALFASFSLINHAQAGSVGQPGVEAEEITVGAGDTLWSVAEAASTDAEIQEVMMQISELNDLDSSELQPGETLDVPAE